MFGQRGTYPPFEMQINLFQADNFLVGDVNQLQPLAFMEAAQKAKVPVTFRMQAGYDHSYYFMLGFSQKARSVRAHMRVRTVGQPPATASQALSSRTKPSALTEKRQVTSLSGGNEPSPRVTRLSSQLAMSTVLGMARVARSGSAAAPPGPPMGSPRRQPYSARASYTEAKTTSMQSVPTRRHIVPPRVRRPSETSGGPAVTVTSSRLTPASVVKAQEKTLESEAKNESAPLSPRNGHGQQTAFVRSRSLQSITEPEVGATPSRVTRPTEASARRSQITPIGGRLSSSASQPSRPHVVTSVWMSSRLSGAGTTPTTPGVRLHARTTKSTMPSKVESTGPVRDVTPSAWIFINHGKTTNWLWQHHGHRRRWKLAWFWAARCGKQPWRRLGPYSLHAQ
eukprot:s312_g12.t1